MQLATYALLCQASAFLINMPTMEADHMLKYLRVLQQVVPRCDKMLFVHMIFYLGHTAVYSCVQEGHLVFGVPS